jgi:hypothetical protein
MRPAEVGSAKVHISFESARELVDNYDGHALGTNSMGQPNALLAGLAAQDFEFHQGGGAFNSSFFGETTGMIAALNGTNGEFRSQLDTSHDLLAGEIWVRGAEVYAGAVPPGATGFAMGLEDANGVISWVDVQEVGGLSRPFDRKAGDLLRFGVDMTKTMLSTLRFPGRCFAAANPRFTVNDVRAVRMRLDRHDNRTIAFDDLEIAVP